MDESFSVDFPFGVLRSCWKGFEKKPPAMLNFGVSEGRFWLVEDRKKSSYVLNLGSVISTNKFPGFFDLLTGASIMS